MFYHNLTLNVHKTLVNESQHSHVVRRSMREGKTWLNHHTRRQPAVADRNGTVPLTHAPTHTAEISFTRVSRTHIHRLHPPAKVLLVKTTGPNQFIDRLSWNWFRLFALCVYFLASEVGRWKRNFTRRQLLLSIFIFIWIVCSLRWHFMACGLVNLIVKITDILTVFIRITKVDIIFHFSYDVNSQAKCPVFTGKLIYPTWNTVSVVPRNSWVFERWSDFEKFHKKS